MACPMGRCLPTLKQPGSAKYQRSRTDGCNVLGSSRLTFDKSKRLLILQKCIHTIAARHADDVELRAVIEGNVRSQGKARSRIDRFNPFPYELNVCLGLRCKDLVWPGQIQLLHLRKDQNTNA